MLAVVLLVAASVEVTLGFGFSPPFLLPAVIAILALEFHWAARLLAWGIERWVRFIRRLRRLARGFP